MSTLFFHQLLLVLRDKRQGTKGTMGIENLFISHSRTDLTQILKETFFDHLKVFIVEQCVTNFLSVVSVSWDFGVSNFKKIWYKFESNSPISKLHIGFKYLQNNIIKSNFTGFSTQLTECIALLRSGLFKIKDKQIQDNLS